MTIMPKEKAYINVLLPLPVEGPFTYVMESEKLPQKGAWVEVPFGNRRVCGVVWEIDVVSAVDATKLRHVIRVLDVPALKETLLKFITWVAEYNLAPLGAVLKMVMSAPDALEPKPQKAEVYYRLKGEVTDIKLTKARKEVIALLRQESPLAASDIIERTGVGASVVKGLVELGMLVGEPQVRHPALVAGASEMLIQTPQQVRGDECGVQGEGFKAQNNSMLPPLSPAQEDAASYLKNKLVQGYSATVLDGVTGSGKTEVYFAIIQEILAQLRGQALILLPEIMLTSQLLSRFEERFGFSPAVWHSSITPKQRRETWRGVAEGTVRLVIGARSALFLPFSDLAFIVVDEEHDGSYKQEEGVIYHARDMAVVRASLEKIPVVLASATPSLESLRNVQTDKFHIIHLASRFGGAVMPDVDIVDMRSQQMERQSWISPALRQQIAETVASGKQALLYLNRRGYAPLTLCRSCGHRLQCPHCASWLVEHRRQQSGGHLQCHHCGYHAAVPEKCGQCGEVKPWLACGPGVERIAEEVGSFLPDVEKILITSDSLSTPKQAEAAIGQILSGQAKVIIGTQMIAKGHHFPNLTLVGVIDADLGLSGGDVRAVERTYQLLHQVAGRAGREQDKGRVVIQSYNPESPVLKALASHRRDDFIVTEMAGRERHIMPPIGRLAAVILSGANETDVLRTAKNIVKSVPSTQGVTVLGPAPAPLSFLRGKYRYRILIKTEKAFPLQKALKFWLMSVNTPNSVRVKVDIDPYNFF